MPSRVFRVPTGIVAVRTVELRIGQMCVHDMALEVPSFHDATRGGHTPIPATQDWSLRFRPGVVGVDDVLPEGVRRPDEGAVRISACGGDRRPDEVAPCVPVRAEVVGGIWMDDNGGSEPGDGDHRWVVCCDRCGG